MTTEVGEYLVGAYLKLIEGCDFVDYNVRTPGGGLAGLNELDVVGLHFATSTAYLCEVTTHLGGLLYGSNENSVRTVEKKYTNQRIYAERYLTNFAHHRFSFWSPVVARGYLTTHLVEIDGLELIINGEYKQRVEALMGKAAKERHETGNPVLRTLQVIAALRD